MLASVFALPAEPDDVDVGVRDRLARRVGDGKVEQEIGRRLEDTPIRAGDVHAELLDDVAPDLGDRHLDHHLILRPHGERIDHVAGRILRASVEMADETFRDVHRLLGFEGRAHLAREDHGVVDGGDRDGRIRHRDLQGAAQLVHVAPDQDFEIGDLGALRVHDEDARRPIAHGDQEDLAGRAHHGVGHLGIGHEHFLGVARKIDDDRLADAEVDLFRNGGIDARHADRRRRVVAEAPGRCARRRLRPGSPRREPGPARRALPSEPRCASTKRA